VPLLEDENNLIRGRFMTVCVAALADRGKTLILAADKMVGIGSIEAEPEVEKILPIHKDWRIMVAGNGISPVFDIVDAVKKEIARKQKASVTTMIDAVLQAYQAQRNTDATTVYLSPRGLTLKEFKAERSKNPDSNFIRGLDQEIYNHEFEMELLVAGFDQTGQGRIFSMRSWPRRGSPRRHDIPGFHAIGSGSDAAIHMMYSRELGPLTPARKALYYVLEAKYFGERASGVGPKTDLYVLRQGRRPIKIPNDVIDSILIEKIAMKLEPRELGKRHLQLLNQLSGISGFPKVK